MDPVFKAYYDILETLHQGCRAVLSGMTQEELDWCPDNGMNSIAILATHIAGAERYWVGDVVMREASSRDRDKEFATTGVSEDILTDLLDSALEYARKAFNRLDTYQLVDIRISPRDGREYTIAWSIAHVLEHTALHLGHMQITKQLLKSR
jgi:hypothetical protein